MVIAHRVAGAVFQTGTGNRTVTPDATTAVGELMIVPVGYQDSAATTITTPAGFTARKSMVATGTLKTSLFTRTKESGDSTFTYAPNQGVETSHVVLSVAGIDPASLIVGADGTRAASGGTTATTAPSITTTVPGTRVYIIATERTTANETIEATVNNGFTKLLHTFQNGTSAESIFIGYKDMPTAGAVGATTVTFQNSQASNGYAVLIAVAPTVSTARRGFDSVAEMRGKKGATWAHRGGSTSYPEHSLYAYQQAAERGYGVLELSMQRTSDGVWFGCHDLDLQRVTGGTAPATDVRTMTWAQVNAYQITVGAQGAPQPFMRWQDFIAAGFGTTHVLVLDPKNSVGTHQAEFLAMVAADVDPARVIMKWSGGLTSFADAAKAAGFKTAGYWYQSDYDNGNLAAQTPSWDYLGMDYTATTAWTGPGNIVELAAAQGKKVWGHIAPTQAAYNTAMSKGADLVQVSGVATVDPVSWWTYLATASQTLPVLTQSASGAVTVPGVTGAAAATLPGLAQSASGASVPPAFTATVVQALPALIATAAGDVGAPITVGDVAALLPALASSAAGTVSAPVQAGTATLVLPGLLAAAEGITVPPGFFGLVDMLLPALTASAAGTVQNPTSTSGQVVIVLPALTSTAVGIVMGGPPEIDPEPPQHSYGGAWPARAPGAERPYSPEW